MTKTINKFYVLYILFYSAGALKFFVSEYSLLVLLGISVFVFLINGLRFSKNIGVDIALWLGYFVLSTLAIDSFHPYFMIEIPIKLFCAYTAIQIFNKDIIDLFLKSFYSFSIISFVIYLFHLILPGIVFPILQSLNIQGELFEQIRECGSILVYSYNIGSSDSVLRNSGFFWEPGAYACVCNIALYYNYFIREKGTIKENLLIVLCLLLTFSTTGYCILLICIESYFLLNKSLLYRLLLIPFAFVIIYVGYNTSFLGQKIYDQYKDSGEFFSLMKNSRDYNSSYNMGRFMSLGLAIENFKRRPIFGYAGNTKLELSIEEGADTKIIGGVAILLARYGLIGLILGTALLYKSGKYYYLIKKKSVQGRIDIIWMIMIFGISISYTLIFSPLLFMFIFLYRYTSDHEIETFLQKEPDCLSEAEKRNMVI